MNIDFRYRSIEIDKEKSCLPLRTRLINIEDLPIEIDDDFYRLLSITINSYRYGFPISVGINRWIKWISIDDIN